MVDKKNGSISKIGSDEWYRHQFCTNVSFCLCCYCFLHITILSQFGGDFPTGKVSPFPMYLQAWWQVVSGLSKDIQTKPSNSLCKRKGRTNQVLCLSVFRLSTDLPSLGCRWWRTKWRIVPLVQWGIHRRTVPQWWPALVYYKQRGLFVQTNKSAKSVSQKYATKKIGNIFQSSVELCIGKPVRIHSVP